LEIHTLTPEGLQPFLDIGIYGRISSMHLFRPQNEMQDLLFVTTEQYKFCVLAYDSATGEIITRANGDIHDRAGKPVEHSQLAIIDPENRLIALHLYIGLLTIIPMNAETGELSEAFNMRIEETQVLGINFLHSCDKPTVAILHQGTDKNETRYIEFYSIDLQEKLLGDTEWERKRVESGTSIIIPVPSPNSGLLAIGETSISYINEGCDISAVSMTATSIVAYGMIDPDGSRFLIGDLYGELNVLILKKEDGKMNLSLKHLGQTSIASTITYLDNRVVFVGSTRGDSQLIRLQTEPNEDGSFVSYLDAFTNLGPIVDFVVVDLERQGQGQIVTCSGAFKDGSLRIIRNGIGINEQASIELPGVKGIWSLSEGDEFDKYLVVSFVGQTRILAITGEEMGEIEFSGLDAVSQTLFCCNIINNRILQVTEKEIRIISGDDFSLVDSWQSPSDTTINIATANSSQILLSLGGGKLVYIDVNDKITETATVTMEHEIACLDIHPLGDNERASYCAVGLWTDISIHILSLPSLKEVNKEVLGGEFLPRSILFVSFDHADYLLCALGDGHLFSFRFAQDTQALHDRKKVSLGTKPISLNAFKSKNSMNVFAASDRPTVIYPNNKKLLYSNVNLKEVDYMCSFNAKAFPESLAIIGEDTLTIGTIDEIQKLHIRTIPLGEMPRRITHQESTHTFLVLTIHLTTDCEENYLRVMDDQTFELIDSFKFKPNENGFAIDILKVNESEEYIAVGTVIPEFGDNQANKGRILLFKLDQVSKKIQLVSELEVGGGVFSLKDFNGKLVVGINGAVTLYNFNEGTLEEEVSCCGNIIALHLAVRGDICAVGDLIKSVSILHRSESDSKFTEIARDYNPNWMTGLEILDDDTYIGAETFFNIFTLAKNSSSELEEERSRLETTGAFHVGDPVNKFRHGSLVMKTQENEMQPIQTVLFATVSGSIGIIATLKDEDFMFFEKVQQSINQIIKGVGGFEHSQWRAFKTDKKVQPAKGFIDGDLVESFLDLSPGKMQEVASIVGVSVEDLCKRIEDLSQALH